ncbi:hypothetical protein QIS99_00005 [Streptomyces sp. B-S-A8]|uniref:Uncharacterized protein n=1 Tax=Streptomyces solicavernae TaxID=3043614 RepID=A0ABT6RJK9_9ACTN|nr:hypothetical protein [Streptomyces sp. B-S-A8]MDI3384614.1 hypothetical protein [Streptomyces sp. B-S-A8]
MDRRYGTRLPQPHLELTGRRGYPPGIRPHASHIFADEVAAPRGLALFIGLPTSKRKRVIKMAYQQPEIGFTTVPEEAVH